MRRVKNSTGVSSLGLFLILIAFAWTCLPGNNLHVLSRMVTRTMFSSGRNYVTEREVQIGEDEFVPMPMGDDMAPEGSGGPSSNNSKKSFSIKSDFLCIYGNIDWGKTIRILMYLAGGALLLLSTVRIKRV